MLECERLLVNDGFAEKGVKAAWLMHSNISGASQPDFGGRYDDTYVPLAAYSNARPVAEALAAVFPAVINATVVLDLGTFQSGLRTSSGYIDWQSGSSSISTVQREDDVPDETDYVSRLVVDTDAPSWYSLHEHGMQDSYWTSSEWTATGDSPALMMPSTVGGRANVPVTIVEVHAAWTFILNGDGSWGS